MRRHPAYAVYGLRVASSFPFTHRLPAAGGPPDLTFALAAGPPPERPAGEVLWASRRTAPGGGPATVLSADGGTHVLRFHGAADFRFSPRRIEATPHPGADPALVELRFLGPVLAFHLERAGVAALHAAAVVVDGRAVAFVAGNRGGKSSLAAALVQRGHPLLSDDVLPVEERGGVFVARPGHPQMRFWPADASRFGAARELPVVHPGHGKRRLAVGEGGFGTFCPRPLPLAALLVPERRPGAGRPRLEPLPPAAATLTLLGGTFLPRLVAAAGLQPARLALLARLVETLPVCRLRYAEGFEHLPVVAAAVEEMLLRRS